MAVFTCYFQNNTPSFVKVVVGSPLGQTGLFVPPGSFASLFLQNGTKIVAAFDTSTGSIVSLFPIFVTGPEVFQIQQIALAIPAPIPGVAPPTGLAIPTAIPGAPSI